MMMDGLDHPKTLDLSARLDVSIPQVIGHLELLWAFTAKKTPHGNIGKWPDGTIARAAQWNGDASEFVTALHNAGFIDACNKHRFVIHDWPEHSPNWVKSKLSRAKEEFVVAECSAECSADSKPSHAKPSLEDISPDGDTSPEDSGNDQPEDDDEGKRVQFPPNCPVQKIVDLYHEVLPELPQVKILTDARRTSIRNRWQQDARHQSLDFWERYFKTVRKSDFLMGRVKEWKADIDFLTKAQKFAKVIEGQYENAA